MRIVRFVLRFFGWLLTPIVAWAASFCGATLGAWASDTLAPTRSLEVSVAAGAVTAAAALLGWLRLLRRSPRLQQALDVTADGTPAAIMEGEPERPGP